MIRKRRKRGEETLTDSVIIDFLVSCGDAGEIKIEDGRRQNLSVVDVLNSLFQFLKSQENGTTKCSSNHGNRRKRKRER